MVGIPMWLKNLRPIKPKTFEEFLSLLQKEGCTVVISTAVAIQRRRYTERWGEYQTRTPKGRKIVCVADYNSGAPDRDYSAFWGDANRRESDQARNKRSGELRIALPNISIERLTRFETK